MKLSEVVNRVMDLALRIRAYYDAEIPKRLRKYPLVQEGEEEPPPPGEEKELNEFLQTLPDEMIYQLVLIVYLYRGYFSTDDLGGAYDGLKENVGEREDAISELMRDAPVLADELTDGLEELHKHRLNVDRLPLKKAKVRKS
jgi:hypothetical protein